jgi:hypothetical protein
VPSGISRVSLYVGRNGHKPHFALRTAKRTIRFRVTPGTRYRFYTLGVDKAGNRQRTSRSASTRALH